MAVSAVVGDINALIGTVIWPVVAIVVALRYHTAFSRLLGQDDVELKGPGGISISSKRRAAAATAIRNAVDREDLRAQDQKQEASFAESALVDSGVDSAAEEVFAFGRNPRILWVDDHPSNNRYEVSALQALGMVVDLAVSTEAALVHLATNGRYDVIISDMGRPPDDQAGYTLLQALRRNGDMTPFAIYASSRLASHFDLAVSHGALGCTNRADELVDMVTNALRLSSRTT